MAVTEKGRKSLEPLPTEGPLEFFEGKQMAVRYKSYDRLQHYSYFLHLAQSTKLYYGFGAGGGTYGSSCLGH